MNIPFPKSPNIDLKMPLNESGLTQEQLLDYFKRNPELLEKELQKISLKYKPISKVEYLNITNIAEYLDEEGGIMIEPSQNFVIKTYDLNKEKIFLNITDHPIIDEPEEKELIDLENAPGVRIPMSVGKVKEDNDQKGDICKVIDVVLNPNIAENIKTDGNLLLFLFELLKSYIFEKHKIQLSDKYVLPKLKYKGKSTEFQRVKGKKNPKIEKLVEEANKFKEETQKVFEENKSTLFQEKKIIQPTFKLYCKYENDNLEEFDGEYDIEKIKSLVFIFDLPLIVTGSHIILEIKEDELYLKNGNIYEIILRIPLKANCNETTSYFNLQTRQLNVEIKIANVLREVLEKIEETKEKSTKKIEIEMKNNMLFDLL